MPTDRSRIEATLRELQAELAESDDIDPELKNRLAAMQAEIQANMEKPKGGPRSAAPAGPSSLTRRLAEAALHLEESHPSLSTTIGSLAGILGQMGL
jgi:hypothetical protein